MTDVQSNHNRFKYIEDARKFALEREGSDVIKQDGNEYIVEPIAHPERPGLVQRMSLAKNTLFSPLEEEDCFDCVKETFSRIPDVFNVSEHHKQSQLEQQVTSSALPVVEFVLDKYTDGQSSSDEHFVVKEGEVSQSTHNLSKTSSRLQSPVAKGLDIVHFARRNEDTRHLMSLSPHQVNALLEAAENKEFQLYDYLYVTEYLGSEDMKKALEVFTGFFGEHASLKSTGMQHLTQFVENLNDENHIENIEHLRQLAEFPERFQQMSSGDEIFLSSLAGTLKEMPGFRRVPVGLKPSEEQSKLFSNNLRQIDQYKYKFRVRQGMQFNEGGIASHGTEINYRHKDMIFSAGFSGKNYNFDEGTSGDFGGYASKVSDAAQRLTLGYSSGAFDIQMGAARNNEGWHIEKPESQFMDRYMARKKEDVIDWAKENPGWAGGLIGGALGGAYLYSLAKPDDDIPVSFNMRQTLADGENWRIKASVEPEITLKGGNVDLGLKSTGIGFSGNYGRHSYDANVIHEFEDTSIGSGQIKNEATRSNIRVGYDTHSLMLDNRFSYGTQQLDSRVAYRKDNIHSKDFRTYVMPYVRGTNLSYESSGVATGLNKQFDNNFSVDLNIGYDLSAGATGGFVFTKEFS